MSGSPDRPTGRDLIATIVACGRSRGHKLPHGVQAAQPTSSEQDHRHAHPKIAAAAGPTVSATHPTDAFARISMRTFDTHCLFVIQGAGDHDHYLLADAPQNLLDHPVRPADLGAFWVRHGNTGMHLLAGMTDWSERRSPTQVPLAQRVTAADAALSSAP